MIDSLLDRATSILERRFLRNAFLPVLLFAPLVSVPVLLQNDMLARALAVWEEQPITAKFAAVIGYFTFCWFGAAVVASQWRNIIRLFEGYPLQRLPWLEAKGVSWHAARSAALVDMGDRRHHTTEVHGLRYWAYPETEFLPTRLGNVIRAAEFYPIQRYGISLINVWPRLYKILPRAVADDVEDSRATMEFLLVLCLWLVGFAVVSPLLAWSFGTSPPWALMVFATALLFAYWAYLSALPAAAEYGEHLRAAFEVHRFDLLRQLRLPLPPDERREHDQWRLLDDLILKAERPVWAYEPEPADELTVRIVIDEAGP
ncbi:hypothetical protein ACIBKY_46755 [Nonomuraea sp. NPDC050394]|uniref:hypothetical protein n=1 Tax=Nonomuraea sp. NPDC050394 TaxID=3364363 RepID=UPI0037A57341